MIRSRASPPVPPSAGEACGAFNSFIQGPFEKKLSKEEKKELAAKKKAEREARKAAAAGEAGSGDAEACAQAAPTTARAGKRAAETLADKVKREQALLDEELEAARIGAVRIRNAEGAFLGQLHSRRFASNTMRLS